MRTIKFRGKTKKQRQRWELEKVEPVKWVYGNLQVPSKEGVGYYMWDDGLQIEVDPETIGQFTSLYDKNGDEIYEGDVLVFDDSYGEFRDALEVRFVRGVFAFLWNGNLDDECTINSPTHEWAHVIGNIHDNPELVK